MANEARAIFNFVSGTLSGSLTNVATTMTSAALANLGVIDTTNHAALSIEGEIVWVTAHTASSTTATILRGREGTTAVSHATSAAWQHAPTVEDYVRVVTASSVIITPHRGQLAYDRVLDKIIAQALNDSWQDVVPLGAWTTFTPTLTQSATVTKTVTYARYTKIGRLVIAQVALAVTGAGTASNAVLIGLPVAALNSAAIEDIGTGHIFDASAVLVYKGHATYASTTTIQLRPSSTTTTGVLGADTFTAALASGDEIGYSVTYEAAT